MSSNPRLMSSPAASVRALNCLSLSACSACQAFASGLITCRQMPSETYAWLTAVQANCLLTIGIFSCFVWLCMCPAGKTHECVNQQDAQSFCNAMLNVNTYLAVLRVFLLFAVFFAGGFKRFRALYRSVYQKFGFTKTQFWFTELLYMVTHVYGAASEWLNTYFVTVSPSCSMSRMICLNSWGGLSLLVS